MGTAEESAPVSRPDVTLQVRVALEGAEAGMAWWNVLTPDERSEWMERAGSTCPADAWRAYRPVQEGQS